MKVRSPSIERLMETFKISFDDATEIKSRFKVFQVGVGLLHAKRIIGGHGIESLYPEYPDVSYVNMGDTYSITLLFTGKSIIISSWGDWVERHRPVKNDGSNPIY